DPRSRASFFGLRPTSDRVTFVLDHSGSMSTALGTRSISRYDEAISQMVRYLQASGTDTRFNVILFDSDTLRSSAELVVASPENVELARASLLSRPPEGGTCLEPAVRLALCVGANGEVDMDALTADTIIVLCDGENVEGHLWVAPLLARVQVEAQVRFHCVQVGGSGGRALRELAALSGGEFIRVDG
ncbi:MAG: vWA domain-containing protein, partial [Polyangiaceae bacterium]